MSKGVALTLLQQAGFATESRKRGHLERQELDGVIREVSSNPDRFINLRQLFFALCEI